MSKLVPCVFFSSERFWYLSKAFLESFSLFFESSYLSFLYIDRKIIKRYFDSFLYALSYLFHMSYVNNMSYIDNMT